MPEEAVAGPDPMSVIRSRAFIGLLVLAAIVGIFVSLAAWCFLELIHYTQQWVYTDLPQDLGYESTPTWWSLPVLAIAGAVTAFAIVRLPGTGGHIPADGLSTDPIQPIGIPGVVLAAVASIGLGAVVGPEAPLIALGGALGFLAVHLLRRDVPDEVGAVVAASGMFASLAFLFGSPLIAAVVLIEAAGLGGSRLLPVLIPGLMAAGIGSLVWIGMGSWTGLSTSDISIQVLSLPQFGTPDLTDFLWTIPFAAVVAVVTFVIFRLGKWVYVPASRRPLVATVAAGLAVSGLAIAFHGVADKSVNEILFSGEFSLGPLVENASTWSLAALAWLIVFKGIAYGVSLGSFRGGPVFPAIFLGAAGGLMMAHLPGYEVTPAVAVGIGVAVVAVLRLPLSAVVLATLLTSGSGLGSGPVVIVGVTVAYLVTLALDGFAESRQEQPA
jgi:H+/Cl- antiporter ClcA